MRDSSSNCEIRITKTSNRIKSYRSNNSSGNMKPILKKKKTNTKINFNKLFLLLSLFNLLNFVHFQLNPPDYLTIVYLLNFTAAVSSLIYISYYILKRRKNI